MSRAQAHAKAPVSGAAAGADSAEQQHHASKAEIAQWRREFRQLTGVNPKDGHAVKAWQAAHGVPATGLIRRQTIEAARTAGKAEKGDPAAAGGEDIFASDGDLGEGAGEEEKHENPSLMENIADGGKVEEHGGDKGEAIEQVGKGAEGAVEGLTGLGLIEETPWAKAAAAPHIVDLLRRGEALEAVEELAKAFGREPAIEAVCHVLTKLGMHHLAEALEASLGPALMLVEWTYEGFKQIHEAHEAGDRESRVRMYASAFADGFLYGEDTPPSNAAAAVTAEQKEAVELGHRDGAATAGKTGAMAATVAKSLLKKHGGVHGARQAIMEELMKRGGV